MRKKIEKDLPVKRPATLGEARKLIEETFVFNRWNLRDKKAYCEMLKISYSDKFSQEEARIILDDLTQSRMVLFTEK